jgi:hypothetical protein
MPYLTQNGIQLKKAIVAIYIGDDGSVLASEKLSGDRTIENNQLEGPALPSDATEIIACEISAALKVRGDGCGQTLNYIVRRVCYDKFGNLVPCF